MAHYELCFKKVETYYHYETVETDSVEEAERIANELIDSEDFECKVVDLAEYEEHECSVNDGCCAWETDGEVTLTEEEIAEYIGGEE